MKDLLVFSLLAGSVVILAGCGQGGPQTFDVSGTVTFDGAPVEQGEIVFRDPAGQEKGYGGIITDGKFSFESSPGKKRVEITAMRVVPGEFDTMNPGEKTPKMEPYIPEKYNGASELTAEVSSSSKTFNFPLTSGDDQAEGPAEKPAEEPAQ